MEYNITPLINAVIALIAAVITGFVIPFLVQKFGATKFKRWVEIAKTGVKAAEMIFNGIGRGEEKKAYVREYLKAQGITYDEATVNNIIESAVYEINQKVNEYTDSGGEGE